jgi:lycopene beta-cyclase
MKRYDLAILGGGASGLSLALALLDSPLANCSILLIEKETKDQNDRTWCYWTDQPNSYDHIRAAAWEKMQVTSDYFERHFQLSPYRYQMVRGIDFYRYAYGKLSRKANIQVIRSSVEQVRDSGSHVEIQVSGQTYSADWVFDSRFSRDRLPSSRRYRFLQQHFMGWEVETGQATFDPQTATLFDLRATQREGLSFFYVLPFSQHRALIEYTVFSKNLLPDAEYQRELGNYLTMQLKVGDYKILHHEGGIIPMTDYKFKRRLGRRVLAIGTQGGRVKPSSGYAFMRIQHDSQAIVHSLIVNGHPFDLPPDPHRRRFYDALLLQILAEQSGQAKPVFEQLFRNNPIARIFRFLDERSSMWEDIQLIASLPSQPFLKALQVYLRQT